MDFNKACDILRNEYGHDLLAALEQCDNELKYDAMLVPPQVARAHRIAMDGFRELFAPKK